MKFTLEMDIDLPRARVIELFDNPGNMKEWQPGLVSFEHRSGQRGRPGAQSKLVYRMGQKQLEVIETVTSRNLPDEFSGTYESDVMWSRVENRFIELDENRTRWVVGSEIRPEGFFKMIAFMMPGAFKKQTLHFMRGFKEFAERA